MTLKEFKNTITAIFDTNYSVQVYLMLKQADNIEIKRADLDNEITESAVESLFSSYVQEHFLENEELELCELSTTEERNNAIYHYDYSEYPEELKLFHEFDIKNAVYNVENFDFTKDDLSRLHGFFIYLGNMKEGILLFKKHYPISLIRRDSFLLGAVKSSQRFKKIAGDDIIRLNGEVHLLRVAGQVFVVDLNILEKNLGFTELIYKAANETIDTIEELALLEDIQVLQDAAENLSFARKLSRVKASPVFGQGISKEIIVEFSKTYPSLAGKFKYSEDGRQIRLDTKKSKEAFVKLLNDSFLHSELTRQYYDVLVKDSIQLEGKEA